ncbi:hypothetical protein BDK51DRAFT_29578, partial [Blyttiomyces helicus]
ILLSAGATVFFGPPDDALTHFDRLGLLCPPKRNPADFFLDILTIDHDVESDPARIRALHEAYRGLEMERKLEACVESGEIETVDVVVAREEPTIIVMLVMGLAFLRLDHDTRGIQNRAGIIFLWPINQVEFAIWSTERDMLLGAEHRRVLKMAAMLLPRLLLLHRPRGRVYSQMGPDLFWGVVGATPLYFLIGLQLVLSKYFIWIATNIATNLVALSLGFAVGAGSPTVQIGTAVGPLALVIFLLPVWRERREYRHDRVVLEMARLGLPITSFMGWSWQRAIRPPTTVCYTTDGFLRQYLVDDVSIVERIGILVALSGVWQLCVLLRMSSKPKAQML